MRQQAITWTNVDSDLGRHMASLGQNESHTIIFMYDMHTIIRPIEIVYESETCHTI